MMILSGSVGKGGRNYLADVKKVQELLNQTRILAGNLTVDGRYGPQTYRAILQYQMSIFQSHSACDGLVGSNGKTIQALNSPSTRIVKRVNPLVVQAQSIAAGGHEVRPTALRPVGAGKLTDADFKDAALALAPGVEAAMIHAFAEVESGGKSGFSAEGNPKVAFEGHVFRRLTNKSYDASYPLLSYPYVKKAGPEWQANNKNDSVAWETLKKAALLDQSAAYQSCSWGMFQVMGFNYRACGYGSINDFVAAMKLGERGQLEAFVGYCKQKSGLRSALENKDFARCAYLYNGADYGDYDKRIRKAYEKYSG